MSGFVRNDWGRYLNGGSSHYNFEYRSKALSEPTPAPPTLAPIIPIKSNKVVIPAQKGGKRKSLRSRRSHKRSNKNKRRQTHRK